MIIFELPAKENLDELSRIFFEIFPDRLHSIRQASDIMRLYLDAAERFMVAQHEEKIIGFAFSVKNIWQLSKKIFSQPNPLKMFLPSRFIFFMPAFPQVFLRGRYACFCGVLPAHQNKDVGTQLMTKLFDGLPDGKVYFETSSKDERVSVFCKKFGGIEVAHTTNAKLWYVDLQHKTFK